MAKLPKIRFQAIGLKAIKKDLQEVDRLMKQINKTPVKISVKKE